MIPLAEGPIVCVGETMAALVPEPVGPLVAAAGLRVAVAGAESNVAMYLADHGIPVRWVSALGDDPFGRRVLAEVAAPGVDVGGVRVDPTRPTGLLVKDPGEVATRVHYYRRGSAASALGPGLLAGAAVRDAALLHLTGITAALSPSCRALVEEALRGPLPVSFDVNYRPALWTDGSAPDLLHALADRADLVFVGLDEAQALWGDRIGTPGDVRSLLPGPRLLVVKDGAHAATVFGGAVAHTVPALHTEVVEPVGAGDAFAAGFLTGLRRGEPLPRALRLAHLTAGAALRVPGDHGPLPPADRIASLLAASEEEWRQLGPPARPEAG
ncbi:2-dehydro-3-deoxygluconate kinase [Actinacidiphila cocklensis]|uniref:2-dehydro-3-deoxygluconate kinase n=2 Tax=Actinacidiphila cocklensis TaxID=887465 RepID=A0A9W4GMV0_9ACTN|nr:2-dehydro-3-deoxygluconate kinase [Actinacidiphila cocklensis]